MSVVSGRDQENRRIVAMRCTTDEDGPDPVVVYDDSVAAIPSGVSDEDAISTYVSALSAVHCALPRVENIGGSGDGIPATTPHGRVVVLGSGDLACFSAEGLASLGMEVFLVNNQGNANVRKNAGNRKCVLCFVLRRGSEATMRSRAAENLETEPRPEWIESNRIDSQNSNNHRSSIFFFFRPPVSKIRNAPFVRGVLASHRTDETPDGSRKTKTNAKQCEF